MGGKLGDLLTLDLVRQVFEAMPQLIKLVNRDGALLYANPPMRELLGVDETTADIYQALEPAVAEVFHRCHCEALELEAPETVTIELPSSSGARTLAWTRFPLRDERGIFGVGTVAVDETERHAIARELARTSGQLRSIIEAHEDILMLIDREGAIQFINRTAPQLMLDQAIGRPMYELVPEKFRGVIRDAVAQVLETEAPTEYETVYETEDGRTTHWEARIFPVFADGGMPLMTVVAADITERRAREQERERFFNISEDILCVLDADGNFVRVNPASEGILGFRPEEMIGLPFSHFLHPDDADETARAWTRALSEPPGLSPEVINRYRHADGSYRKIAWRGAFDNVVGVAYGVGRDVTDRLALEEKLRHAQKMEAVGQLAGGIAHDFNNIALSILLNAELGLRGAAPDVIPKSFREIRDAAQRAADLTRQLLAFSRQTVANFELLDLNHIADGVILLLRRLIPESIAVDFIRGSGLPAVRADRGQIEQVIMNLCLNARDAMPNGGRIEIETRAVTIPEGDESDLPPGQHVLLSVTDTGTGIDDAMISRIFEPFFTTKPPGSGTGLGLATVYGVVQQHEAMIQVDSEPGKGTCFKIHLPATNRRASVMVSEDTSPVVGGTETILLAEDEALVRAVVVRTLTEAGYAVVVAADGIEAVELAERDPAIELALLDMVMPNLSGTDAYERIRSMRPDIRFLFSSGYVGELPRPDRDDGKPIPLIRKPYRPDQLLREIRRVLDE